MKLIVALAAFLASAMVTVPTVTDLGDSRPAVALADTGGSANA